MNEFTLQWIEADQPQVRTFQDNQSSKHPGTIRIGRDPNRCDLVLTHPTVSGLHIEIFFNSSTQQFCVRNLRETNPPRIDGKILKTGESSLYLGSCLQLGQIELRVVSILIKNNGVPSTVLLPPLSTPQYGLQCPKCDRISPYERLEMGCPWCGTSLAAAISVVLPE